MNKLLKILVVSASISAFLLGILAPFVIVPIINGLLMGVALVYFSYQIYRDNFLKK